MKNQSFPRRAPGGPGIEPRWTHGAKVAVGTAYSTSSRVWYTLDAGCVTEVYYPTIDTPQIRDLQFLFTDAETFFHDERRNFTTEIDCVSRAALGFEVTNRENEGRYTLRKTILGDPYQNCLLIHVRVEASRELLSRLKMYVLCAPHLEIGGWHNNGEILQVGDYRFLIAYKGSTCSQLAPPLLSLTGNGPEVHLDIFGTGFLASAGGQILTNHHVGEPWWQNDDLKEMLDQGLEPVIAEMAAYFPGVPRGIAINTERISSAVDVAIVKGNISGLESNR